MTKAHCIKCGYEWDTTSKMFQVTCPRCGKKTPINNTSEDPKNGEE